jgi:hypothetical protein
MEAIPKQQRRNFPLDLHNIAREQVRDQTLKREHPNCLRQQINDGTNHILYKSKSNFDT